MKNRLPAFAAVLLIAMLACKAVETDPLLPSQPHDNNEVVGVQVIPPSGSGNFTLEVNYKTFYAEYGDEKNPGYIYCNYVAPDMATMSIGVIEPPPAPAGVKDKWVDLKADLPFSVVQANGSVQPGTYLAGCKTSFEGRPPLTATFMVVGDATPTAPSVPQPVPTATLPAFALTWGRITYDKASDQQSPHLSQSGLFPSEFHKWCNPSITIDANGAISGTCSSSQNPADLGLWGNWMLDNGESIEGKITGTLVPGGSFTFREELTESYKNPEYPAIWWYTKTVVIEGTGTFVSTTQARGTATYLAECIGSDEDSNFCGEGYTLSAHDSFTGTINWEFNGASQ